MLNIPFTLEFEIFRHMLIFIISKNVSGHMLFSQNLRPGLFRITKSHYYFLGRFFYRTFEMFNTG